MTATNNLFPEKNKVLKLMPVIFQHQLSTVCSLCCLTMPSILVHKKAWSSTCDPQGLFQYEENDLVV